ncbi:ribonuclease H [Chlorella sorokiniana]|uniref:ribonuclease H n=1 Tax=Chlorella sorokiniana TaxID=3076 RepID=A0A2P6TD28_CHLSO|nr:ribonuclease H [Chlorella sorokiniana]|eukprot:PRW20551.1 ribonuclease H [Chlorella sorokiniana]
MAKNFYAVATGRRPGLFRTWDECQLQVKGYPKAVFKGFKTEEEARQFLRQHGVELAGGAPGDAQPAAAAAAAARRPALDAAPAQPRKRRAEDAGGSAATKRPAAAAPRAAAPRAAAAAAPRAAAAAGPAAAAATGRVFRLEFDGGSKGNPGPAGFGAVLYDDASGVEVARLCQYIGDHNTNNQAEYAGLIAGLAAALELGCSRLKVQGDSMLVINQVLGRWQVKTDGLRPYHRLAQQLARRFDHFEAKQVLREFNQAADALSNQAVDDYRSGANRQKWTLEGAAAAAEAARAGAAGLAAQLHAADAELHGGQAAASGAAAAAAAAAEGKGAEAAAAAAAAEGDGSSGNSGGEEVPAKRARRDG